MVRYDAKRGKEARTVEEEYRDQAIRRAATYRKKLAGANPFTPLDVVTIKANSDHKKTRDTSDVAPAGVPKQFQRLTNSGV